MKIRRHLLNALTLHCEDSDHFQRDISTLVGPTNQSDYASIVTSSGGQQEVY